MAVGLPRVTIQPTRDLSFRVPPRGGNGVAAILVNARKGPIEEPVYVGSESEYLRVFCPDETISVSDDEAHHSAISFLSEGAGLYAVRPRPSGINAAHASIKVAATGGNLGSGLKNNSNDSGIPHTDGFDPMAYTSAGDIMTIMAKTAGEWGNNISVAFEDTEDPTLDLPTLTIAKEVPTNLYRFSFDPPSTALQAPTPRFPLGTVVRVAQGDTANLFEDTGQTNPTTSGQYNYDSNGAVHYQVSDDSINIDIDILTTSTIMGTGDERTTTLLYNVKNATAQSFYVPLGLTIHSVTHTPMSGNAELFTSGTGNTAGQYELTSGTLTMTLTSPSHTGTVTIETRDTASEKVTSATLNATASDTTAFGLGLADTAPNAVIEDIDRISLLAENAADLTIKSVGVHPVHDQRINFPANTGDLNNIKTIFTRNNIGPTLSFNLEQRDNLAGATIYVKYRINEDKSRARTLVVRYEGPDDDAPMEVERFIVSPYQNLRDGYGRSTFAEDSTAASRYIILHMSANHNNNLPPITDSSLPVLQRSLTQGVDGMAPTGESKMDSDVEAALMDTNNLQFSYLLDGGEEGLHDSLQKIATERKDCIAVLSATGGAGRDQGIPSTSAATTAPDLKGGLGKNSSFSAMYSPYIEIHDKFNDRALFVPPDGYAGAIMARTVRRYKPWTAPAGQNYARLDNIRGLAHRYSESQAGNLYDRNINPIIFKPGQGFVIYGQKTTQTRASALDRINVRFLLNEVLTNVKGFLDGYLFTENDIATRVSILTQINGYMDRVRAGRGVTTYQTVCDETNNTPEDIDANTLNVAIVMQPTRATEYINLLGVLTRTGATFTETLAQ